MKQSVILIVLLAAGTVSAAEGPSFDAQRLSQHVKTLSSDAFEGRGPNTAGEEKTVAYLIEQFKAAGLDKLSADELKQLDNWITGVKTVVVEKVVEKQIEKPAEDFSDINSALVGEFRGWRGYTEFNLANGQVWMQAAPGELFASKLTNPKVRLVHNYISGWKLQVEGYNSWVKVRRIK